MFILQIRTSLLKNYLQSTNNFVIIFTGKDIPWINGDFQKYLGINEVAIPRVLFFTKKQDYENLRNSNNT